MLTNLSLFSGIGGIDLGAELAGVKTVGQVEIDDYCTEILEKHWPDVPRWRDIYEVTGREIVEQCGPVSIISGGFPCQPVSAAGKARGTQDTRWLWGEMLRLICEIRPKWVVGENVKGLLWNDKGRTFGTILKDLVEAGYSVGWACYGAEDVGAPHKRERVFILAYSDSNRRSYNEEESRSNGTQEEIQGINRQEYSSSRSVIGASSSWWEDGYMADTNNSGDRTPEDGANGDRQKEDKGRKGQSFGGVSRQSEDELANSSSIGWFERSIGEGALREETGWSKLNFRDTVQNRLCPRGAVESRMGYCSYGIPKGLARFPSRPGEQFEWEPPRVTTNSPDRKRKLKALGNSVVPAQIYPVFRSIVQLERGGGVNEDLSSL